MEEVEGLMVNDVVLARKGVSAGGSNRQSLKFGYLLRKGPSATPVS